MDPNLLFASIERYAMQRVGEEKGSAAKGESQVVAAKKPGDR